MECVCNQKEFSLKRVKICLLVVWRHITSLKYETVLRKSILCKKKKISLYILKKIPNSSDFFDNYFHLMVIKKSLKVHRNFLVNW